MVQKLVQYKSFFTYSIAKKLLMSLSGLFMVTFLITHLSGNLQLLFDDGGESFNRYAKFMTTFPVVKAISYLLYLSIILHAIDGLYLAYKNKTARPVDYAVSKAEKNSTWYSRSMALLGSLILFFLVIHLYKFWFQMHWGDVPVVMYDGEEYKDLYALVFSAYKNPIWVAFYVLSMIPLAYHLLHGFQSGFQTLGINHSSYTPIIKALGIFISVVIPIGFAIIPVFIFLFR
jgi:succinate dehydrogenase / fumarate reductase cytochrome b subunit